jgi:hypothetical protein
MTLRDWVAEAGGLNPRVMRTHYGSLGAPDLVFEQEVANPDALEHQIKKVDRKITGHKKYREPWINGVERLDKLKAV